MRWMNAAALVVAMWVTSGASAQEKVVVEVPAQVVVAGERIWLGEVARLDGPEDATAEVQRKLDHVSLGPAPRPGESRDLTRGTIETRLRSALGPQDGFEATIPERVEVSRAATWIPTDQLQRGLEAWIVQQLGIPEAQARILYLGLKGPIPVPLGPYEMRFTPTSDVLVGSTAINVTVWQRGAEVARQRAACKVEVSAPVVVVSRAVAKGRPLSSADLSVEQRTISRAAGALYADAGAVLGLKATRALTPGEVVTDEDVVLPDDIDKGAPVTVWVRSEGLTISAPGEARGNGHIGDTIPVWCEPTGKILKARIVGPGEVEVLYMAAPR